MTDQNTAYIFHELHKAPENNREQILKELLQHIGITEDQQDSLAPAIKEKLNNRILQLNSNQLKNLLDIIEDKGFDRTQIENKLSIYQINKQFHDTIFEFLEMYSMTGQTIDSSDLDNKFKGVKVASRDDFHKVIHQGWTGDWDLN